MLKSDRQVALVLKRIARISAWLLLAGIIVLLVSGWGITRTEVIYKASFHLIDRGLANRIHHDAQIPVAAVFITHVLTNARLNLPSRCFRKAWLLESMLAALGIALLAGIIYMEYFA